VRDAPRLGLCQNSSLHVATIPLGLGSLRNSSSLPEGRGATLKAKRVRAGPALPSYLALLHAGFSVPRVLPLGRWALTPPFHPYQCARPKWRVHGFSVNLPQRRFHSTGGLFSVALSVAAHPNRPWACSARHPLALPGALPFVDGSFEFTTMESGLSSRPPSFEKRTGDHPAHPLSKIITGNAPRPAQKPSVGIRSFASVPAEKLVRSAYRSRCLSRE